MNFDAQQNALWKVPSIFGDFLKNNEFLQNSLKFFLLYLKSYCKIITTFSHFQNGIVESII